MKTKNTKLNTKIAELVAISLVFGSTAFAQTRPTINNAKQNQTLSEKEGTGAGNGSDSDREAYISRIKQEIMASLTSGAGDYDRYVAWCNRITSVLNRELTRADRQMQRNQMQGAEYTLIDALKGASWSLSVDPELGGPMTKTLIDRVLVYTDVVKSSDLITRLNFLQGSFKFIINTSEQFDPTYYIPYHYRRNSCEQGFDLNGFERKLVALASEQTAFLANTFTESCAGGTSFRNCPVGDATAFLKISELASQFVANDLKHNLHSANQACNIRDLEVLSSDLVGFNQLNDRTVFSSKADAVDEVSDELKRVSARIRAVNHPCGSREDADGGGGNDGGGDGY